MQKDRRLMEFMIDNCVKRLSLKAQLHLHTYLQFKTPESMLENDS